MGEMGGGEKRTKKKQKNSQRERRLWWWGRGSGGGIWYVDPMWSVISVDANALVVFGALMIQRTDERLQMNQQKKFILCRQIKFVVQV